MQEQLNGLAQTLMHSGYQSSHSSLLDEARQTIGNPRNLEAVLSVVSYSQELFILVFQTLTESIKSGVYASELEKYLDSGTSDLLKPGNCEDSPQQHLKPKHLYFKAIINALHQMLVRGQPIKRINQNFIVDLASSCLSAILEEGEDIQHLDWFIGLYFPVCLPETQTAISPEGKYLLRVGLRILRGFVQNHMVQSEELFYMKSHLMETFQEGFIRDIMSTSIKYLRHFMTAEAILGIRPEDETILQEIINLIDDTLNLFSCTRSFQDQMLNYNNAQTFPVYLNVFWSDNDILPFLYSLSKPLISNPECPQASMPILHTIFRVIKTVSSINPPHGGSDKLVYQTRMFHLIKSICVDLQCYDSLLITTILKMLHEYLGKKGAYTEMNRVLAADVLEFCCAVVSKFKIIPRWDAELDCAFKLARSIEKFFYSGDSTTSTRCLMIFFERLASQDPGQVLEESGFEPKEEVLVVADWLKGIPILALDKIQQTLEFIAKIDPSRIRPSKIKVWIYAVSLVLFNNLHRQNYPPQHSLLVKSYLNMFNDFRRIQVLFFIRRMITKLTVSMCNGVPTDALWEALSMATKLNFYEFLCQIIGKLFQVFCAPCYQVADYVLDTLLEIYTAINCEVKEAFQDNFNLYFNQYKEFLMNIHNTVFNQKEYYSKRKSLMNIAVYTELQNATPAAGLSFYKVIISNKIADDPSIDNFQRFMYDVTGILVNLSNQELLTVLLDYVVDDLTVLYQRFSQNKNHFSQNPPVMRALMHLLNAIAITTSLSPSLKYKVHRMISLVLPYYIRPEYSKKLLTLFLSYVTGNQVAPLEYFPPPASECRKYQLSQKNKLEVDQVYNSVVQRYFKAIRRVKDLEGLEKYIGHNVEYLFYYHTEAMRRGVKVSLDLATLLNSKIWKNNTQLEMFSRILYRMGWHRTTEGLKLPASSTEDQFVKEFSRTYKR